LSLWEHGNHIYHHLEWSGDVSTNHYLSNLLGLVYVGLALDETKWIVFARMNSPKRFFGRPTTTVLIMKALQAITGWCWKYSFSMRCSAGETERECGPWNPFFLERLRLMFEAVLQVSAGDGTVPSIGDNDSGHVHVFSSRDDHDMAYLSGLGAVLLDVPSLKIQDWAMPSELLWLFGWDGSDRHRRMKGIPAKAIPSKKPSQSGLLTLRGPNDVLVFFRCAQWHARYRGTQSQ